MAARGTGKTISQLFSRLTPFPGNLWILLRGRGKKLYDEYCDHMMEAWRFLQSAITEGVSNSVLALVCLCFTSSPQSSR